MLQVEVKETLFFIDSDDDWIWERASTPNSYSSASTPIWRLA